MFDPENFKKDLFFTTDVDFETKSLELFEYQWSHNPIYRTFCNYLNRSPNNVAELKEIPFLPINFFKSHAIKTGSWKPEKTFLSSGTTGSSRSKNFVKNEGFYHAVCQQIFENTYGSLSEFTIKALLPSYIEQGQSSLISMVNHFINNSSSESAFISNNESIHSAFYDKKLLLIGVSYALLDFNGLNNKSSYKDVMVMETGGMKGRRKEIIREELHDILQNKFQLPNIHSEYGMTELSSQAYGINGLFQLPKWSKCLIRDTNDPLRYVENERVGGINIIDLANVSTCAFIETKDLGKVYKNGLFEVLGRFDNSDIRGCNLLM